APRANDQDGGNKAAGDFNLEQQQRPRGAEQNNVQQRQQQAQPGHARVPEAVAVAPAPSAAPAPAPAPEPADNLKPEDKAKLKAATIQTPEVATATPTRPSARA